jgi:GNAT superfamily N-acetyltransferase
VTTATTGIAYSSQTTNVDWDQLVEIFRRAPLGERQASRLRRIFEQSTVCCFAWAGPELIGAGRAISDRISYAAIFDVVVAPEFQNRGVGTAIMQHLMRAAEAPNVILHAVPGKEGFYAKMGFRKMKTAMAHFALPDVQQRGGYIE